MRQAHRGYLPVPLAHSLLRLCLALPLLVALLLLAPLPALVTRALRAAAPQQPRRFIPPPLSPAAAAALRSEPACGAPAPRRPACEAWCPTSPFAPFAAALSGSGRGCWDEAPAAANSSSSSSSSSALPPRTVLLFTGVHGLADTLAGALSALLIAALAGAEFHMRFSDSPADPSFLWAYDPNCIDALGGGGGGAWPAAAAAALAAGAATRLAFPSHRVPPAVLAVARDGDVRELWGGRAVLALQTHAGLARHLLRNPRYAPRLAALGLTQHSVLAEAYHFLLRPRAAGLARFAAEVAALTTDASAVRIAIHVRTGASSDDAFAALPPPPPARAVADYAPFFHCAAEAAYELMQWGGLRRAVWLLLSDSPALRAGAAAAFPPGTLLARAPGVSVRHSRTSDLQVRAAENATCGSFLDAAMEHWLFGLADAHVVTAWSGYGRTGALLHVGAGARLRPLFQLPARGEAAADCGLAAALGVQAVLDMPPGV